MTTSDTTSAALAAGAAAYAAANPAPTANLVPLHLALTDPPTDQAPAA